MNELDMLISLLEQ